ncbi:MAG: type II toxin-antitoxin system RatA family toxin [Zetaproteobacteria bacterium]|nr:MAG: type II toxin-antitoxin system RatA family toxin [Zetaproteobacteria bacterium]
MRCFEETRELAVSPERMFDIVMDIDAYPAFLPWVADARVLTRKEGELTAELAAELGGRQFRFRTIDRFVPGKIVEIRLLEGPFNFLESVWTFEPASADAQGCRVHFSIEFEFRSSMLDLVASPLFATACRSMVHAFERRALELAGEWP